MLWNGIKKERHTGERSFKINSKYDLYAFRISMQTFQQITS